MMRIKRKDIQSNFTTRLFRYILNKPKEGTHGLLAFGGEKNDYPQLFEALINNSTTATAIVKLITMAIVGQGFEDERLNKVIVGRSPQGKNVTLLKLVKQIAQNVATHQGYYVHTDYTIDQNTKDGKAVGLATGEVFVIPFKNCRFPKKDDDGYSAKVLVYNNWAHDLGETESLNYTKVKAYDVFNQNPTVLNKKFTNEKGEKVNYKGQVFFSFFDERYDYPLNTFDSAANQLDTESHLGIFQNNEIRNGFTGKTIVRMSKSTDSDLTKDEAQDDFDATANEIVDFIGSDASKVIVLEDENLSEDGEIKKNSQSMFENVKSSIEADLFNSYHALVFECIRLAGWNVPKLLLNPDVSLFGTSGEGIQQAFNFLNAQLKPIIQQIEQDLQELFAMTSIPELKDQNINFKLKPLSLEQTEKDGIDNANGTERN